MINYQYPINPKLIREATKKYIFLMAVPLRGRDKGLASKKK